MEIIDRSKMLLVVNRALNLVDPRLMNHGLNVAYVLQALLEAEDRLDSQSRKELGIMALLHDIGAYQTEEIDNLLRFETDKNVWTHAIHSSLFLKRYFLYDDGARVVLYHHARYYDHWDEDKDILRYGQMLHHIWERLDAPVALDDLTDCQDIFFREATTYLNILVDAIDFRSRVTVLYTRGVMEIARELARIMDFPDETQSKIYYGAMIHGLGKIGIPVSILEKPGKLTPEDWPIMKLHVTPGEQIVDGCIDQEIIDIGMRHHEKLNGTGYPRGLTGDQLTKPQRLLAAAIPPAGPSIADLAAINQHISLLVSHIRATDRKVGSFPAGKQDPFTDDLAIKIPEKFDLLRYFIGFVISFRPTGRNPSAPAWRPPCWS